MTGLPGASGCATHGRPRKSPASMGAAIRGWSRDEACFAAVTKPARETVKSAGKILRMAALPVATSRAR